MTQQDRSKLSPPLDWYRDAVIYELHVRAFRDSDGDGVGDFRGLTEQLDYLQDLGVTALWLLPFYPSPLKDDGYDISDYMSIHPSYGTMRDFKTFMREATRRGLRVITELVVNHTSDQHAWFQRARHSPEGSALRDFYVWSETPERYREARIIFQDFESSNWAWDSVANAYYWHRFYTHQPDLNYDNPRVREAIRRVMDFWLDMGVAGMRLDAVPYLYERDGTNCENLPETHAYLKELRAYIDRHFPGRLLLSEANQWPEDAAAYFGNGDETHMAYHFPLMPRLFMAVRMEDHSPVVDILEQTPHIPDGCQWAIFLRNHDELTLEMVTDEERDYMYRIYAHDRQMRVNLGIRRRLAPLMNNDRRRIELMNGLLLSLPGTPVLYYGDEIGMGDNFFLGDRNGVRTPMQWSIDRNAGFSRANPQQLYLPVIADPEYHYETVNVEVQDRNPDSLLWWMRRTIALRKAHKAFGRGSIELLRPGNSKVLAYVRRYEEETLLVVANLSRHAQHVMLDVQAFKDHVPVELFGQTRFPKLTEGQFSVMLAPYGFYWFALQPQAAAVAARHAVVMERPELSLASRRAWDHLFEEDPPGILVAMIVEHMLGARWFGGKSRVVQSTEVVDAVPVPVRDGIAHMVLVRVGYAEGEPDVYDIPIALALGKDAEGIVKDHPAAVLGRAVLAHGNGSTEGVIFDPVHDPAFGRSLLSVIGRRRHISTSHEAHVAGSPTRLFSAQRAGLEPSAQVRLAGAEQSNTSLVFGDRLMLKLYRRLGPGTNPELETGRFLLENTRFQNVAPLAGAIEYTTSRLAEPMSLAVLNVYVENAGDAWAYTLDQLAHYYERVLAHPELAAPPVPTRPLAEFCKEETPANVIEIIGPYLVSARLLGRRTGELHKALASRFDNPAFAPEPFTQLYQRAVYQGIRNSVTQSLRRLRQGLEAFSEDARLEVKKIIDAQDAILKRVSLLTSSRISAMRIRNHGDYHLGQVLYTGRDFVIIDFEGEPARPHSERKLKRSPLADVAGMVRSLHYAAFFSLYTRVARTVRPDQIAALEPWARVWHSWVSAAFLDDYLKVLEGSPIVPSDSRHLQVLLDVNLINKALYEVWYDLNNRPDWVRIPVRGVQDIMESPM